MEAVAVKDSSGAELGNHPEQAELSHVEMTSAGMVLDRRWTAGAGVQE